MLNTDPASNSATPAPTKPMNDPDAFSNNNMNSQQPSIPTSYGQYPPQSMMMPQQGGAGMAAPNAVAGYNMNMGYPMPYGVPPGGSTWGIGGYPMNQTSMMTPVGVSLEQGGLALAKTAGESGKTTKAAKKRKKPKDKPKRPLSAYNLFFQEERAQILKGIPNPKKTGQSNASDVEVGDGEKDKDDRDDLRKPGKKQPHGKIGFESLAKTIGKRWKELSPERMAHYKALAEKDTERYKKEMAEYTEKVENEKQNQRAESDSILAKMGRNQNPTSLFDDGTRNKKQNTGKKGGMVMDQQTAMQPGMQYAFNSSGYNTMGMPPMGMQPVVGLPITSQQPANPTYNCPAPGQGDQSQQQQQQQQSGPAAPGGPSSYGVGTSPYSYPSYPNYGYAPPQMYPSYGGGTNYGGMGWQQNPAGGNMGADGSYNSNPQQQQSMPTQSPGGVQSPQQQ